jgi:hypothetical protein
MCCRDGVDFKNSTWNVGLELRTLGTPLGLGWQLLARNSTFTLLGSAVSNGRFGGSSPRSGNNGAGGRSAAITSTDTAPYSIKSCTAISVHINPSIFRTPRCPHLDGFHDVARLHDGTVTELCSAATLPPNLSADSDAHDASTYFCARTMLRRTTSSVNAERLSTNAARDATLANSGAIG